MNRTELITATALVLFAAFVLGWLACWLIQRLTRPAPVGQAELERMAERLRAADDARAEAAAALAAGEAARAALAAERDEALATLRDSQAEIEELRSYIERKLARR